MYTPPPGINTFYGLSIPFCRSIRMSVKSLLIPFLGTVLVLGMLVWDLDTPATAQSPFSECTTRTATNATLILPNSVEVILDGESHGGPLHVAAFSPEAKCAGTTTWNGEPTSLTVWGTNDPDHEPPSKSENALHPGDPISIHLYNPDAKTKYDPSNSRVRLSFQSGEPHLLTNLQYVPDGIYVLDKIRASRDSSQTSGN